MAVYTITGVTGFIGSKLLDELVKRGHKVNVLVRNESALKPSSLYSIYSFSHRDIETAIKESDHVIHLAALYTTGDSLEDTQNLVESNVLLSSLLLSAISNFNPTATFVSTSTFSSYNEYGDYDPSTVYSATKTAVEAMAPAFKTKQTVFLTLAETYGPGDNRPKIHNLLRNSFEKNQNFEMRSPKEQIVNLTHVQDVVNGLIYASETNFESPYKPFVYDFFYDENSLSLGELADMFSEYYSCDYSSPSFGNITLMPKQATSMPGFELSNTHKDNIVEEVRKRK